MKRSIFILIAAILLAPIHAYAAPSMPPAPTPYIGAGQATDIAPWSGGIYLATEETGGPGLLQLDRARAQRWSAPVENAQTLHVLPDDSVLVGDLSGIARYRPPAQEPLWRVALGGAVRSIDHAGPGRVVVTGAFPRNFRVMRTSDGARLRYRFPILHRAEGRPPRIDSADVQPGGNRLAIAGAFDGIDRTDRTQLAMLVIGRSHIGLAGWDMPATRNECGKRWDYYVRQVKWSPDGTEIAFVTTGGRISVLCDGLTRVRADHSSLQVVPRTLHTCYDTLTSLAWTPGGTWIYVAGHHRCIATERGPDGTMVQRYGLARVRSSDLTTDRHWRVDKCRAYGPRDLHVTAQGDLEIAQDCDFLGNNEASNERPTPRVRVGRYTFLPNR